MNSKRLQSLVAICGLACVLFLSNGVAYGQTTNSWSNSFGGLWETATSWSLGVAPTNDQAAVLITNANTKTISISDGGPGTHATISNLVVTAPVGTVNTLELNNFESPGVFTVLNGFTLGNGGAFVMNAATARVDAVSGDALSMDGGVTLNGGLLITTNANPYIGDTGSGSLTVNAGTWLTHSVWLGNTGGSQGTLTVGGGTITLAGGSLLAGFATNGTGVLWVKGGQLEVELNRIVIGAYGVGQMTVSNGTVVANVVRVGSEGSARGTLTVAGGTLTLAFYWPALGDNFLEVGPSANATGAVWVTGGQLTATNAHTDSVIAYGGVGEMTVSNGTVLSQNLVLGVKAGSQGTFTVAGGTNTISMYVYVGDEASATGAVWITGGRLATTNDATYLGKAGVGQMTVSNGTWLAREVYVGYAGTGRGTLTVAGGTNSLSSSLTVGEATNAAGAVWVAGGQLAATNDATYLGKSGVGQMAVSNGTVLAREMYVGASGGSQGTLTVAGGTNSLSSFLTVGDSTNAAGAVWVAGGQLVATNGATYVGKSGVGQMTVSNGTVMAREMYVGYTGSARGTLAIAGGTNTLSWFLDVGAAYNATSAVWVTGGQLAVTNDTIFIAYPGVGQMSVSNGSVLAHDVVIGPLPGSCGTLNVAGGSMTAFSKLVMGECVMGGTGVVNVAGGQLFITNAAHNAVLDVRNGTVILSSGLLSVDKLVMTNACGLFMRTGGTLITGTLDLSPGLDADGDGLPNFWEQSYGLDPLSSSGGDGANGDPDGDGLTNQQELLAGTAPNDASSALRITSVAAESNDVRITWSAVGGKSYAVQTNAPSGGSFTNNFSDLSSTITMPGLGGESTTNYLDTSAATNAPARYYRVRLVP